MGRAEAIAGVKDVGVQLRKNPFQFALAVFIVASCGASLKFQTFPMPWIAAQAKCSKLVKSVGFPAQNEDYKNKTYKAVSWIQTTPNCKEPAKVFSFVTESFTLTTANLVFFGVGKAIFNFVTGFSCDKVGRKWTMVIGWILGIPMPLMVIFAKSWWDVAVSNIFLGMQQALVWSATIFIMVDYLGQKHTGVAIGINETVGYTVVAIANVIAGKILDVNDPRGSNFYVLAGIIGVNLIVSVIFLRESKPVAVKEEADLTQRTEDDVNNVRISRLQWPSGRASEITVTKSAFIYTSFVNNPLMSICFAGLMINFISGFAWGLFVKWQGADYVINGVTQWKKLSVEVITNIGFCYAIPKGILQWIFGYGGDRFGRKWFIVAGMFLSFIGLMVVALTGELSRDPEKGFSTGSVILGIGTAVMYSNALAAVCDFSDPSWRSTALGAYRFWRDLGFALGALITGSAADQIGIFWSVILTAILTMISVIFVAVAYTEAKPTQEELKGNATEEPEKQEVSKDTVIASV